MEGIGWVAFAAVLVVGIGSVHLGEILLKQVLPHVGGWLTGRAGLAPQGELADIRREMEAARREISRLRTLEEEVGRLQVQVELLEKLLDSGGSPDAVATLRHEATNS
jgi:hypothetical protein